MDDTRELKELLARHLGAITTITPLARGRNSRTFRVVVESGRLFAVKCYADAPGRGGMDVEYAALRFLEEHNIAGVPRAVVLDRDHHVAVFEFVEGAPVTTPTDADIDTAVDFVVTLDRLAASEPVWPHRAAETCFSAAQVVENIRGRIERLERHLGDTALHRNAQSMIEARIEPLLAKAVHRSKTILEEGGLTLAGELPVSCRILSPSDFGFHNALRRPDGQLVFLDFEFFGWDDPAKLISDFLLHPAMKLSESNKRRFTQGLLSGIRNGESLVKRMAPSYTLFALKWCCILLNEFVPEHLARRRFAGETRPEETVLAEQLDKVRRMCDLVEQTDMEFPYID